MKNSHKIICITVILISLLTIVSIIASGIFFTNIDTGEYLPLIDNNSKDSNTNNTSGIKWNEDFQSAISESKKTNKNILLYFSTSWCYYCNKLDSETFTNQDIQNIINNNYIPVKVDGDTNPELCSRYNVLGFPTMVIIDSNEKKLKFIEGFHSPSDLLNKIS